LPLKPTGDRWIDSYLTLDNTGPELLAAAQAVKAYCADLLRNRGENRLLVLYGETGTGKTHIARSLFWWFRAVALMSWEKGWWRPNVPSALFRTWAEIADEESTERATALLNDARDCGLIVLDDVGTEVDRFKSGLVIERLRDLLSRRDKPSRWTVITTNVGPEWWAEKWDMRVADRLLRGSRVVSLAGVKSHAVWKLTAELSKGTA